MTVNNESGRDWKRAFNWKVALAGGVALGAGFGAIQMATGGPLQDSKPPQTIQIQAERSVMSRLEESELARGEHVAVRRVNAANWAVPTDARNASVAGVRSVASPHSARSVASPWSAKSVASPQSPKSVASPHSAKSVASPHSAKSVASPHRPKGVDSSV